MHCSLCAGMQMYSLLAKCLADMGVETLGPCCIGGTCVRLVIRSKAGLATALVLHRMSFDLTRNSPCHPLGLAAWRVRQIEASGMVVVQLDGLELSSLVNDSKSIDEWLMSQVGSRI